MSNTDYDIVIVGGGMVGATLAHALAPLGYRIAVIEATPIHGEQPSYDTRAIALSHGSVRILDAIGVWDGMCQLGTSPIRKIHVSDRGHFGAARLSADEEGVDALGHVVEARVIGAALMHDFHALPHTDYLCPASVTGLQQESDRVRVHIQQAQTLSEISTQLLIAADGGQSPVRDIVAPKLIESGYGQTAIIANVVTDRPHDQVAFERFTDSGPLALLPNTAPIGMDDDEVGDHRWSLVWTVNDEDVDEVLAWNAETFLKRLQERFGYRAGRFLSTTDRYAYPLAIKFVANPVQGRVAFIGNAAHLIHPVGGQGLNLGIRDVAMMTEVLAEAAREESRDPGAPSVLKRYRQRRTPDYLRTALFTDTLVRTFSNQVSPLVVARNLGLLAMDAVPLLRRPFARLAMGLAGRQPRLPKKIEGPKQ